MPNQRIRLTGNRTVFDRFAGGATKLAGLLAAHQFASNRVIAVENLGEGDLSQLRRFYCELTQLAEKEDEVKRTHSLDNANHVHARKAQAEEKTVKASRARAASMR